MKNAVGFKVDRYLLEELVYLLGVKGGSTARSFCAHTLKSTGRDSM